MWIENSLLVQCFPLKVNRNRTSQEGVQALKQYGPDPNLGNEEKETHAPGQMRDWWECEGRQEGCVFLWQGMLAASPN